MAPPAGLEPATHGLTVHSNKSLNSLSGNKLECLDKSCGAYCEQSESLSLKQTDFLEKFEQGNTLSISPKECPLFHYSLIKPDIKTNSTSIIYIMPENTLDSVYKNDHTHNIDKRRIAEAILAIDKLPLSDSVKTKLITKIAEELNDG